MRIVEGRPRSAQAKGNEISREERVVLETIDAGIKRCSSGLLPDLGEDMSQKDARSYRSLLADLCETINRQFPEDKIDLRAFVSGLLAKIEDIAFKIKDEQRSEAWSSLAASLNALYLLMDPDLEATDQMDRGERFAEAV